MMKRLESIFYWIENEDMLASAWLTFILCILCSSMAYAVYLLLYYIINVGG